jgi:UDP-glucose 4-epimerase
VPREIGPQRAGDPARLIADPTRARAALGWRPARSDLAMIIADAARGRAPGPRPGPTAVEPRSARS